jgi:hypothetical protein
MHVWTQQWKRKKRGNGKDMSLILNSKCFLPIIFNYEDQKWEWDAS